MQRRVRSFDGTVISYDVTSGTSEIWLVFLHGVGGDLTAWNHERAYLRRAGIKSLAIDLRGHGVSDRPPQFDQYELEAFTQDVREVIEREQISKYILVGHCFGGMIASCYQARWPNEAAGYVFIDTTYRAPAALRYVFRDHPYFRGLLNYLLDHETLRTSAFVHVDFDQYVGTSDWNYHRILSDISHTTWRSWLYTYEHLANFDGRAALRSIRKPTLILEGTADLIFPPAIAEKIHQLVPHSRLKLLLNASHILVINQPKDIAESIYVFYEEIRNPSHKPRRKLELAPKRV